jgi:hypothetical protein
VLLVVISVPLAIFFARAVESSSIRQSINQVLTTEVEALAELQLLDFNFEEQGDTIAVTTTLYASVPPTKEFVDQLDKALSDVLERPILLNLISIPVTNLEASSP